MFRLQIGKLRLSAQFQPERSAWELNSLVGLREEKDADQEKGQAMDRTPRIPSRALGSRSAASAARSAAGSGALEVRADPKGNLGKPRSGIPPPHHHHRFSTSRRRGPAPGSISPARAANLPPRLRGSPGRSPGVLALSKFPWLGGWGWGEWRKRRGSGGGSVSDGGGRCERMGFPLPGELRTTTSLYKIP